MNIDTELSQYISILSFEEKKLVLSLLRKLRGENEKTSINKALMEYNLELEEAVRQIKNGEYIEHADILKEAEEW